MTKVFVGADSGGTRTNVIIKKLNDDTNELESMGSYESSQSLAAVLRPELIPEILIEILSPINSRLDDVDEPEVYVWISAAGFAPPTREIYLAALTKITPKTLGQKVAAIGAANDAVTGLLGNPVDAIVVAGTGSNMVLRHPSGELRQVGGDDWVASDNGSGFWIGLRGIREAYRDYQRKPNDPSTLLQRLYREYGIDPTDRGDIQEKMLSLAVGDRHQTKRIARFATAVCSAATRGDHQAQNIVASEAEDLADMTAMGFRREMSRDALADGLKVLLAGAVLSNEFYRTRFEAQLRMRLRGYGGEDEAATLAFSSVETLTDAAAQLAEQLAVDPSKHLHLGNAHRPVVVAF